MNDRLLVIAVSCCPESELVISSIIFFTTQDIAQADLHFSKGIFASSITSELEKDGVDPDPARSTIIRCSQQFRGDDLLLEKLPNPCRPLSAVEERHAARLKAVIEVDV